VKSELVKPTHLARKAVVYIRQSTPHQTVSNQESLRLQYALRQRARELGWHDADIDVIDADLGLSGASTAQRSGFKELVGRVGLSEVGLILSIDVTRLARNCSDWYPLLDICGLRACLIADRDGVYDPGSANGRLLLGLKGTISELELHTIRSRLTAGLLAKAERGELALTLPVGLVRDPSGVVVKDPDIEVQERLELVFQTFLKFRTVAKVMRVLNERGLDLPRRDRHGDLCWTRATVAAVSAILQNPAYAGAFVYGRTCSRSVTPGVGPAGKAQRPIEEWRIVVKDRYPSYIDWPTYEKIRCVVRDNRAEYMRNKTRGAPRDGDLLLHGIVWCARCGHKMYVRYKGGGEYVCNHLRSHEGLPACQSLRAARLDAVIADAFLTALAPAELDALSRARQARHQVDAALRASAERQLERKRYAAALAERQFNRVDPDNRLVAGELERRWEAALNEVRMAEEALAQQSAPPLVSPMATGKAFNSKVIVLARRLPQIWRDPATSDAQRKTLLRCLVEKVVLDRGEHDIALVRIVWRGGAVSELEVKMRVNAIAKLTRGMEMRDRVLDLARAGMLDDEIATTLTDEGHRSPNCAEKVLPITVQRIRLGAGLKVVTQRTRWNHNPGLLSATELAAKLNIPVNWLYVQIRQKRLLMDRQPSGAYLFENTASVIDGIRNLRNHAVSHLDLRICQSHKEGHQHA
jgi:DNA invertase Pin-like site-specific DNA recombinase